MPIVRPNFYPSFFRDWTQSVLRDWDFRARHPHMHQRVVATEELASIVLPLPGDEHFLRAQAAAEKAFIRGDRVKPIVIAVGPTSSTLELRDGGPILAAARALEVNEILVRVRYDSLPCSDPFWVAEPRHRYG